MKSKVLKILLIIFLSVLAIGITWFMISVMNGKFSLNNFRLFSSVSNELVLDEMYHIDFNKVDIKSSSGDVYIRESTTDEVKVIIYGNKENITVNTNNNELNINIESEFCIGFCFGANSKVEVYLPNNYDKLIKISNEYGNIEIDSFKNATIDIEEKSGDVSVLKANIVKINNEYGNIEIGDVNEADVHDSAGNITINSVYDAKVKNEFGNIEIGTIFNSLDLKNDCGDIRTDNVILNKDSVIKNSLGNIKIGKTNEIYMEAKTELGNVKVKNNYPKSDVILKIENECGDIEVDN